MQKNGKQVKYGKQWKQNKMVNWSLSSSPVDSTLLKGAKLFQLRGSNVSLRARGRGKSFHFEVPLRYRGQKWIYGGYVHIYINYTYIKKE
jgi:hypothetical protein